jgi:hypothetical protein
LLDVAGSINFGGSGNVTQTLQGNGTNTTFYNSKGSLYVNYDSDNNGSNDGIIFGRNRTGDTGGTTDLAILEGKVSIGNLNTTYNLDISGTLRNTTDAYFATSSGSVGIGTTSPTNKLMLIAGNSSGFNLSYDTSGNNRTGIFAWTNASSGGGIGGGVEQTSDFVYTARSTSASYLSFGSGNIGFTGNTGLTAGSTFTPTTRLLIWGGTGNISIGNTNNTYNLDVSGTLRNTTSAYFATSSGNVGLGVTTASAKLHIYDTAAANQQMYITNNGTYHTGFIASSSATPLSDSKAWGMFGGPNNYITGTTDAVVIALGSDIPHFSFTRHGNLNGGPSDTYLRITSSSNIGIGQTSFGTSATKTLAVSSGTAPTTSPADAFQMYSADVVAGNAAAHFRTENGAVVKIYQETTAVAAATLVSNAGTTLTSTDTFDGYTIRQIAKALRNLGILQ